MAGTLRQGGAALKWGFERTQDRKLSCWQIIVVFFLLVMGEG